MKNIFHRFIALFVLSVILIFSLTAAGCGDKADKNLNQNQDRIQTEVKFWTCSMHPQVQQPGPGQCPLCGMDLIPVSADKDGAEEGARELTLSPYAIKLAEIQTVPVERKFVTAEIRMSGKVEYDETRLSYITAWFPGRIERLYVDYTGVRVNNGDHLVSIYSPELITAQQELLLGLKMLKGKSGTLSKSALTNVEATREKLRLWGLTGQQIKTIEKTGKVSDRTTIYSPISGIVVYKNGVEGKYLKTGTRIYTIADLSQLWIKLDVYESDIVWVRAGQDVEFTVKSYPGEIFKGKITFIDPILNPETRTIKARVNVQNPDGKLKPDMFVSAVVYPKVAAGGKVMDSFLVNKWICSMHPEIVKEKKGYCDICEMPLVTSKSLGYESISEKENTAPIVIPVTAPLVTGKRAVVYVKVSDKEGTFEGRDVVLGPRAGSYYIVKEGLKEGDLVVVNGNFKIDSAIQILAKPSMMNPAGGVSATGHEQHGQTPVKLEKKAEPGEPEKLNVPSAFIMSVNELVSAYYKLQHALSHDNYQEAVESSNAFMQELDRVDMSLLKGKAHMAWMSHLTELKKLVNLIIAAKDINTIRNSFDEFSDSIYTITKQFGVSGTQPVYRFLCPMANDGKGAYWLQDKTVTENPYFGSKMFKCGSQVETVSSGRVEKKQEGTTHE